MFFWLVIRSSPRDADLVEWRSLADPRAATAARPSGQIQVRNGGEGGLASPSLWDASLVGARTRLASGLACFVPGGLLKRRDTS